jgi:hypothetical protein
MAHPGPQAAASTTAKDEWKMTYSFNTRSSPLKAAVVRHKGGPFQIETLLVDQPRADEVLVRIVLRMGRQSRSVRQ